MLVAFAIPKIPNQTNFNPQITLLFSQLIHKIQLLALVRPHHYYIPLNIKQDLSKQLEKLNPFVLREATEKKLKKILNPSPPSSSLQRSPG